jgi:hypothetical protein
MTRWWREQDSNPRSPREGNYAHETASFDRYDVSLTSSPRSPALQTANYLDDAFGNQNPSTIARSCSLASWAGRRVVLEVGGMGGRGPGWRGRRAGRALPDCIGRNASGSPAA